MKKLYVVGVEKGLEQTYSYRVKNLARTIIETPKPLDFLNFVTTHTFDFINARGVILGVVQRQGLLNLVGTFGFTDKQVEPFVSMPIWTNTPITDCLKKRKPLIFASQEELFRSYPVLAEISMQSSECTIAHPLISNNIAFGAVGITCENSPGYELMNSEFWDSVMSLIGIYLKFIYPEFAVNINTSNSLPLITDRQIEIIKMFEENLTINQIAKRLNISVPTVKGDITKLFKLFQTRSRQEIIEKFKIASELNCKPNQNHTWQTESIASVIFY